LEKDRFAVAITLVDKNLEITLKALKFKEKIGCTACH